MVKKNSIKKNIIIFDLDGVLINSKKNMEYAWKQTCEKHNLKIKFKRYFSYVGFPFFEILKKLKINKKKFATLKDFDSDWQL